MSLLKQYTGFVRLTAALVGSTFLSACMTWHTQSLQPLRFLAADSGQTMRLTLTTGETIMVHAPVVRGEALVGMQTRPRCV
jgi:hypothetical protein